MEFYVDIKEKEPKVFTVSILGPLDTNTHLLFEERIKKTLEESPRVIILNMEGVNYISSMGVGVIFKIKKTLKQNRGTLLIINPQPQIRKVFEIIKVLPDEIFSSLEEADEYLSEIQKNFNKNKNSPL